MKKGEWTFDAAVAGRFSKEARGHIPNYENVIRKCVQIAEKAFPDKQARIIDVGSATGYTLQQFHDAGFTDIHGVENSAAMIAKSLMKDRVIHSSQFPTHSGPFDLILANWTLHFVRKRDAYIRDIHASLSKGGIFVLSEKMHTNPFVHSLYHDFKRSMGVSDREIARKEAAVQGILVPYTLNRYIDLLSEVGFKDVSVVDAHWRFNTLIAFK